MVNWHLLAYTAWLIRLFVYSTYNHNYWIIAAENRQNGRKRIEKSGLSHLRSFVIVIRSA